ncbi:DUF6503 family protein [Tenacibaculum sp. IMCC1]|uniref:Heat-shock protein Hsp90 n=1 Tax=Tenacibaculum sp. Pbs-1 TaxID=3238748 RepID=A0AB33KYU3_9FLAO
MKKRITLVILLLQTIIFVAQEKDFTPSIEKAHHKKAFMNQKYLKYDIDITFGGKNRLTGTITQEPGGGKIKIEKNNGEIILFDGKEVYSVGIKEKDLAAARFDIFTWSYFLGLPYKLNDDGTIWSNFEENKWGTKNFDTGKLTFASGTGDAPDDWYVIYKNPSTNFLEGAAYIVTFGKGKEKAEKEPHAIKYNNIELVNSIPFATNWTFHMWSLKNGYEEEIGEVKLSNIKFIEEAEFVIPTKAKLVKPL